MKVFPVAGGAPSWWKSGWGQSLISADAERALVSFVEYSKDGRHDMQLTGISTDYEPPAAEPRRKVEP
jgi:hypothetical protein